MNISPKKVIIGSTIVLVSFISGIIISPYVVTSDSKSSEEIRKNFNYQFINPLIECENYSIDQNQNLNSLKKSLQFIIDQNVDNNKISFASIYYRDLNNGPWFGINEKEYFSPASLIKVPIMIAYLKSAETDPSILTKKILNNKTFDYSQQNIVPTQTLETNKEYTVEELIERMIIYSDNASYDLLLGNIDGIKIYNIYKDLDVDISKAQTDPNGNIITVSDYASFFRILYNASYLNKEMSEKALSILSKSTYHDALAAGVPENIKISHKFGERQFLINKEKQLHDCGIVYSNDNPYLLCVMTRGNNFDQLTNFIKQISKTVYDNISI